MDDHWPVRNVFYERLRCWHLAWDSKLLSWQFDNTSIFWNKKKSYRLFLWLIPSKKYEKKFQCQNRHPPKSSNSFQATCRGPIHVWDKKGMYKFSQKCTKGLKNVQNLDARLFILWFLRQKCAYFAIFETQLRDGEFDHQKDSAIFGIHNTSQTKVNSFSVCRHRQFLTSDDLNVRKFQ